jgi:hypothetical protein
VEQPGRHQGHRPGPTADLLALEAGKYVPSLLLAFRLAAAFGVKVEDVFQYEGGSSH